MRRSKLFGAILMCVVGTMAQSTSTAGIVIPTDATITVIDTSRPTIISAVEPTIVIP